MKDWKQLVASVAPTLSAALLGPAAGIAVKALADGFLTDDEIQGKNTNQLEKKLAQHLETAGPEELAKLQELDHTFKLRMEELGVDVFKIEANDKKSARRENKHSRMPAILSIGLTLAIAGIVVLLFYVQVPTGAKEVLFMLLGVVVKEWGNSMQYWFGTTRSSGEKTKLLKGSI
jgi:hypothetical protein